MALEHNVDLNADRLDPQISDTRVAAAAGAFKPTFNTSVQLEQPAAAAGELPDSDADADRRRSARTPASASGCRGSARPTASAGRRRTPSSNSFLNSYNPLLQSGLSINVSQPLLRDFVDRRRRGSSSPSSRTNRDIADTRLRESLVHTDGEREERRTGTWWRRAPTSTRGEATLRAAAGAGAREQGEGGRRHSRRRSISCRRRPKSPSNQEQLIIAETAVKQAEDRLRMLIFDPTERDNWNVADRHRSIRRRSATAAIDVDAAVTSALARARRPRCARARTSRTRRRTRSTPAISGCPTCG